MRLSGFENGISRHSALAVVLLITLAQAWLLNDELAISRYELNDSVFHYTLADGMVKAAERGDNPLDFWASEWSLGYPVLRTYQPLGHLAVFFSHYLLAKSISTLSLFVWMKYLLVVLFPLTVYCAARLLALRPAAAVAAAAISPLISTNGLFGVEYGSYLWRGSGLFTQSIAAHLMVLAIGCAFQFLVRGRLGPLAGALIGLAFLGHFIYGWMAAVSVVLLALLPLSALPARRRLLRLVAIGLIAGLVASFELVPLLRDAPLINQSRWEFQWKWDSFGFGEVMRLLFRGELFDYGRLPVVSLVLLAGAVAVILALWRRWDRAAANFVQDDDIEQAAELFLLAGFLLWLALFCGKPTWGSLLYRLLGAGEQLQLHRLIGGVHVFAIFLAAVAAGRLWSWCAGHGRRWMAAPILFALFLPVASERAKFLRDNSDWGKENLAANVSAEASVGAVVQYATGRGGRIYPGLAAGWGKNVRVGSVPFYSFASTAHLPAVAFLFHAMALTSDIMVRFDENRPDHFALFDIRTVVADRGRTMPAFLTPSGVHGTFQVLEAPHSGYFDLVSVPYSVPTDRHTVYDISYRWMQSDWVAKHQYLWLDFFGAAPDTLPRLSGQSGPLPAIDDAGNLGTVEGEQRQGEIYKAQLRVDRDCYLLFKMTYHPNWRVFVDGKRQKPVILSPGFLGVTLGAGRHSVEYRYQPEAFKSLLMAVSPIALILALAADPLGWTGSLSRRLKQRAGNSS